MIDLAIGQGLYIAVDMHAYRQLDGDPLDPGEASVDDDVVNTRFVNIWAQLAVRYGARSDHLVYELYNEPHNRLTPSLWNTLATQALAAIRTSDPDRVVMLGPTSWCAPSALGVLALPNDPNLIVTIHDYDPFDFTFQGTNVAGSSAWIGTTLLHDCGATATHRQPRRCRRVRKAARLSGVLGEFGSSPAADEASRVAYTGFACDQAEARAMPWAIWSLIDKGIYDPTTGAWLDDVKNALLGP